MCLKMLSVHQLFENIFWKKILKNLQLMFPNHSLDEICYHAEAHVPLIKYEPFVPRGKNDPRVGEEGDMMERFPHIHVGVSLQNMAYTKQIAAGGILGKANSKDSEIFKKACDEILSVEFNLQDAVARVGKPEIQRQEYEENFKVWKRFEHAAKQRTKGKELLATFDPAKDFTEMIFEDLTPKITEPIKEPKKEEQSSEKLAYKKLEDSLKSIIGSKVSIKSRQGGKGRIEIDYYSVEELDRIAELLSAIKIYKR